MAAPNDIETAEPTELVYVPNNSWAPVIVAAGITLILVGFFKGWFLWAVGAFILLLGLRAWWHLSNDEIARHAPRAALRHGGHSRRAGPPAPLSTGRPPERRSGPSSEPLPS